MAVTDPEAASVDLEERGRIVSLASKVPPTVVAVVLGLAISVFVVMGILQRTAFPEWNVANLDSEGSVATGFAAALLWGAAFWWLLVAVVTRPVSAANWLWWPVLAWLAIDEGTAIHERLERWSGIDWQLLYVPVMVFSGAVWWGVVRTHRRQARIVALLFFAAAAWGVALVLELVQNWGGPPVQAAIYVPTMITEEALEMIGSTALLIAGILALRESVGATPKIPE
ncbi:MAG: hypothetical protein ACC645_28350 [Pirellulales bacterium]